MARSIKVAIMVVIAMALTAIIVWKQHYSTTKPVQPVAVNPPLTPTQARLMQERRDARIIDTSIPKSTIWLEEMTFNFGNVKEGDIVTHDFKFTNTGANPLVIYNVQGTCGCTVPNWPKNPIKPGDKGKITIQYNSKNEHGLQNKKVRIFSNTKPMETDISFTAEVKN